MHANGELSVEGALSPGSIEAFDGLRGSGQLSGLVAPLPQHLEVRLDGRPVVAVVTLVTEGDCAPHAIAFEFLLSETVAMDDTPVRVSVHLPGQDAPLLARTFPPPAPNPPRPLMRRGPLRRRGMLSSRAWTTGGSAAG